MNTDSRLSHALRHLLLVVTAFVVVSPSFAGSSQTNPPDCDPNVQSQKCPCSKQQGAGNNCVKISLDMGATTPWSGSQSASLRVFADDFTLSVFTPECLYPILGYTYKRLGTSVLSDGETPKEIVFTHPTGEPIHFVFNDGETTAMPDRGRHVKMDERLMMVDAAGWAVTSDPVYYDLYENDGSVRRFLATDRTGERGRLVYIRDSRGVVTTPEEMGVDFVRNADGLRQFLTPSRLADVILRENGYDVNVYALREAPVKSPSTGLYAVPASAPVTVLTLRQGEDERHVDVTLKSGSADPVPYAYEFADGDWTLTHVSGRKEVKTKQVAESVGARITKSDYDADGRQLTYSCKNYRSFEWGFSMTNKLEGCNGVTNEIQWTYVASGSGKGLVASERYSSGLVAEYVYDSADRTIREVRSGVGMLAETVEKSYASVDSSDVVPPVDARPRTTVKKLDGVEVERTYHVYGPWTEITERAAAPGADYGAAGALRTVKTYWDADSGVKAGKVKSIRREDGRVDAYDYTLADGVWTETVTHLHEQAMEPVSGKTTRDVSVMNRRGETLEYRTEAFVAGTWYTVAKTMQEFNAQGKVVRSTDLAGRVTTTAWDCCHKISETKPDGQTTTWDYDTEGRMIASSRLIPLDATNVTWVTTCYRYDAMGRQTATWTTNYTEHVGTPATTTSHDGLGRVISRTIPGRGTSQTSYFADGLVVTNIAPNGATSITCKNSNGDTLSITGTGVTPEFMSRGVLADGTRWTKTVQGETASSPRFTKRYENLLGQSVRSEKSGFRGAVLSSVNTYDSYGRLVSSASDGEPVVEYTYDTFGNRIATTRTVGRAILVAPQSETTEWRKTETVSSFILNDAIVWLTQTNIVSCSDSAIVPLVSFSARQLTGLTASLPSRSRTTDIRGNVTENETLVDSAFAVSRQTVLYATNKPLSLSRYGVSLMEVSVSAVTNTIAYDSLGRQISNTDGRGNTRHTEYNSLGQRSASIDALGNRKIYAYDQFGNLASVTDPLGNATIYEYDLRGNKTYEGGATYPVRYTYDVFGNKTTMTTYRDETGGTGVSPVQGDVTTWLYDEASGSLTNKVYADGKGPTYSYTTSGKLSRRIWARGIVTDYAYDNWGSLTNTVYSDNTPTIALSYDALGRQTEACDAAGVTTFLYDSFGSLTNETVVGAASTNTIERFWDDYGRTVGYALNGIRQTTIGYGLGTARIETMQVNESTEPNLNSPTPTQNSNCFVWSYLPGTDLKSALAYPNGLTASWSYDANSQLLQVCNAFPTNVISQYDYTYDAAGRRVACGKSGSAFAQNDTLSCGYNEKSELTNAVAAVDSDYRYAYDFDDIGNRESSSERGTNSVYTANSLNQYVVVDDFIPQFDDDGNQTLVKTATGIWSVTYNGENRPVLWENVSTNSPTPNSPTPSLISMSFDRMGRRVAKNGQRFVYDGYLQIANFERASTNSQLTTYNLQLFLWDPTEPVATRPLVWHVFRSLGKGGYYTHDGNKNVSEVMASNGALAAHYDYAPFGGVIAQRGESASENSCRFSSEFYENDLDLIYYNYRHYEPIKGRWLSADFAPHEISGLNKYAYCYNYPLSLTDYAGLAGDTTHGTRKCRYTDSCSDLATKLENWIKHYKERQAELIKDKLNLKEEDPHRYNNHIDKALEAITNISRCRGMIISHTPPCDCPPPIPVLLPLPERVPDLTPCQKIALWVPFSDETLWAVQRGCLCVAAGAIGAAAVGSVPAVIGGLAGSSLTASRMLQAAW